MPSCRLKKDVLKRADKRIRGNKRDYSSTAPPAGIPSETHPVAQVRHVCRCVNTGEEETRYDINLQK